MEEFCGVVLVSRFASSGLPTSARVLGAEEGVPKFPGSAEGEKETVSRRRSRVGGSKFLTGYTPSPPRGLDPYLLLVVVASGVQGVDGNPGRVLALRARLGCGVVEDRLGLRDRVQLAAA